MHTSRQGCFRSRRILIRSLILSYLYFWGHCLIHLFIVCWANHKLFGRLHTFPPFVRWLVAFLKIATWGNNPQTSEWSGEILATWYFIPYNREKMPSCCCGLGRCLRSFIRSRSNKLRNKSCPLRAARNVSRQSGESDTEGIVALAVNLRPIVAFDRTF